MRCFWLALFALVALPARGQELKLTGPLANASWGPPRRYEPPVDDELHVIQRVGFAWIIARRAPALSMSLGVNYDVVHVTRRLSLTVASDIDDRRDPVDMTSFGAGVGLFYGPPRAIAFGFDGIVSGDWDGQAFVGVGLSVRFSVVPFYLPMRLVDHCVDGPVASFVASAVSIWALARADWVAPPNRGSTLAFGVGFDLMRALVDPVVQAASSRWFRCTHPRPGSARHEW